MQVQPTMSGWASLMICRNGSSAMLSVMASMNWTSVKPAVFSAPVR